MDSKEKNGRENARVNGGKKPKRRRGKSRAVFKFAGVFLLSLIVCSGIALAIGWNYVKNLKPPEVPSSPLNLESHLGESAGKPDNSDIAGGLNDPGIGKQADRKDLFYTFLILGVDKNTQTDTIMVASYDADSKEANIVSLPRDSLVDVSRSTKKINAAYANGYVNGGGKEGGVAQLGSELRGIFGFVPDYYIMINLQAFEAIVDAVGGVEVDVPLYMKYDDPFQDLHIDIPKGRQTLDGWNALRFARYREGNNGGTTITDYQRIENQQQVIKGLLGKLLSPASLLRIDDFIGIFTEYVDTDIPTDDILWFANQLLEIDGVDALSSHTVPTTGSSGASSWYEFLDEPGIVELINKTVNPYTRDISAADLDIYTEEDYYR